MTDQTDIEILVEQEKRLVFPAFSEEDAFRLGAALKARADRENVPLVIDISLWDRRLFYFALPGSTSDNEDWVRRKFNLARRVHKSSYRAGRELSQAGLTLKDRNLAEADYAAHGGAFPIRLSNAGAIGAVTLSGLPQRDDHNWAAAAIAAHLGIDISGIALP
jgi:uncharacterized protein (UPF0303 family)